MREDRTEQPRLPEASHEGVPYSPFLPSGGARVTRVSRSSRAVAWLMDELVSIPGTNIRFGLDPLLGLFSALGIPVGDMTANLVSSVSLVEAIRRGLPIRSTVRILGNILLNSGVGSIPVAGDLFSVLFRSNSRNRDLIEGYLSSAESIGKKPSWWRVAGSLLAVVVAILLAVLACLLTYAYVTSRLWQALSSHLPTIVP